MTVRGAVHFLRLARPLFLLGGILFHGLGVAMARFAGATVDPALVLWTQLAVTSIQLLTHFSNDYFDLPADRANSTPTRWSGGSRILVEGHLRPAIALRAALTAGAFALAFTAAVHTLAPWPLTVPLLLLSLVLAWSYSGPPLRLHTRGFGEITVAVAVPVLTPLVGFYVQRGSLSLLPILATLPLACFQMAMILIINFPDAAGDRLGDKRTLVIQLGPDRAARLTVAVLAAAYLSLPILVWAGLPPLVAASLVLTLPLGVWQAGRLWAGAWRDGQAWDSLGFWAIGLLMLGGLLETVAFLWIG